MILLISSDSECDGVPKDEPKDGKSIHLTFSPFPNLQNCKKIHQNQIPTFTFLLPKLLFYALVFSSDRQCTTSRHKSTTNNFVGIFRVLPMSGGVINIGLSPTHVIMTYKFLKETLTFCVKF